MLTLITTFYQTEKNTHLALIHVKNCLDSDCCYISKLKIIEKYIYEGSVSFQ